MNNTKDNPFAQDNLPIGTVVEWEGKKVEVVNSIARVGLTKRIACSECYFKDNNEGCGEHGRQCRASKNSDGIGRHYILINEQQEEEAMSIALEDGKKYVTEGGEVVTMVHGEVTIDHTHPFKSSNGFYYTKNGKLYSNGDTSPSDITGEYIEDIKQEPKGHVHAKLMLEYGKDALVSKEPWKDWQYKGVRKDWTYCNGQPCWNEDRQYRRKPKIILINGYEVPDPLRVAPEAGTIVFAVSILDDDLVFKFMYTKDCITHNRFLSRSLLHLTKESAQLHAKALLSFTTVQEKQDAS